MTPPSSVVVVLRSVYSLQFFHDNLNEKSDDIYQYGMEIKNNYVVK
jgi:hypothetical protein